MNTTIKSQDRKMIVRVEQVGCISQSGSCCIEAWGNSSVYGSILLGLYSTEERAAYVLNDLNNWMNKDKPRYICYEMPADNEELDVYIKESRAIW